MSATSEIQELITLIAAVIAAFASALSLRGKSDRIRVGFGSLYPPISPGESLYVISQCDHFMKILDFGFIDDQGRLLSLPQLQIDDPGEDAIPVAGIGKFDKFGDVIEYGPTTLRDKQIGAYAITAAQDFHRIAFRADIPRIKRLVVRTKILLSRRYQ